jgi:hypothetical protein
MNRIAASKPCKLNYPRGKKISLTQVNGEKKLKNTDHLVSWEDNRRRWDWSTSPTPIPPWGGWPPRGAYHGRPLLGDQVALGDDPHALKLAEHGVTLDAQGQVDPLRRRRLQVEVQDVLVARVVDCLQRPPHPQAVPLVPSSRYAIRGGSASEVLMHFSFQAWTRQYRGWPASLRFELDRPGSQFEVGKIRVSDFLNLMV